MNDHYPPNWDDRPRVKPWNSGADAEYLSALPVNELVSRVLLLQAQMTKANQDRIDDSNLNIWNRHQLVEALGEAGRVYKRLLEGRRKGRKSMRLTELFDTEAN